MPQLCIAQDDAADELFGRDPFALPIGMLLGQNMRRRSSCTFSPRAGRRTATNQGPTRRSVGCPVISAINSNSLSRGVLRRGWSGTMAWLSVVASLGALSLAITQAQTGYSDLSMTMQLGLYLGFAWIAAVGLYLFFAPELPESDAVANGDHTERNPAVRGRADAPGRR